jgi:hypothetical protein
LLVRYGVSDRVELRVGFNYEVGGGGSGVSGAGFNDPLTPVGGVTREADLSYGFKARLTDQDGWRPRAAVILTGTTPAGGSPGTPTATELVATGVLGWELPAGWRLDGALRYGTASEGGDRFNRWAPSAVLRVPAGERWAAHAEYFGLFTAGKAEAITQHYFSTGGHFLPTPDFEVGVRVGWGLNDQAARFFTNVGFGWRF